LRAAVVKILQNTYDVALLKYRVKKACEFARRASFLIVSKPQTQLDEGFAVFYTGRLVNASDIFSNVSRPQIVFGEALQFHTLGDLPMHQAFFLTF
jgi:hypothetical protein